MKSTERGAIMRALRAQGWSAEELATEIRDILQGGGDPALTPREKLENKKWAAEFIRKAIEHEEGLLIEERNPPADYAEAMRRVRAVFSRLVEIGALRPEAMTLLGELFKQAPRITTVEPIEEEASGDDPSSQTFL